MADETPRHTVTMPPAAPAKRPSFEVELDGRTDSAQERFKAAHPELYPPPVTTETAPLEPPAPVAEPEPPAALPTPDEDAPAPEPFPEPEPEPPPVAAQPPPASVPSPPPAPEPLPQQDNSAMQEVRAALRRMERENRRLQRELEARNKTPQPTPTPSAETPPASVPSPDAAPTDDDPLGIKAALREATERLEQRYQARDEDRLTREREAEQRRYTEDLDRSEREYAAEHPDYYDAVQHTVNWERQRYQLSGASRWRAAELLNDPQYQPAIEKVADEFVFVPHPEQQGVVLTVRRDQLTPEMRLNARELSDADAAECLATDLWIQDRRNEILRSNRPGDVPRVVWNMATRVAGYQPRQTAPATAVPAPANGNGVPPRTTAERIRQQARVNAGSRSLSNASGTPTEGTAAPQIGTLRELMDWRQRDPVAARAWMEQMSRRDPNWQRNLRP